MSVRIALAGIAAVCLVSCAPQAQAPQQEAAAPTREEIVARGEYLVLHIAGCNDCHTPMTPQGPDMTQSLVGSSLSFAPKNPQPWADFAPPLAGLPSGYTEAQLAHFLQTGERAVVQTPTLPPMPMYRMNAEDAAAVAAYIASMPKPTPPPT
jgi:mono/diheme cytochrome c family protein